MLKSMSNGNNGSVKINVERLDKLQCNCGGTLFQEGNELRQLSALDPVNLTHKEQIISVPVYYCVDCNTVFDPNNHSHSKKP